MIVAVHTQDKDICYSSETFEDLCTQICRDRAIITEFNFCKLGDVFVVGLVEDFTGADKANEENQ